MKASAFFPMVAAALLPAAAWGGVIGWWPLDGSAVDVAGTNPGTWNGAAVYNSGVAAPGSTQAGDMSNTVSPKRFVRGNGHRFRWHPGVLRHRLDQKGAAQGSTVMGDMLQGGTFRGWEMHVGTTVNGGNSAGTTVWLLNTYPSNAIQVSSAVNVLNNAWHHVAFTYDGSKTAAGVKIYVDGAPAAATATLNTLTATIAKRTGAELNLDSGKTAPITPLPA